MDSPRVLLTGGNGFIASHILDALLQRTFSVTVTVRSADKGWQLLSAYPDATPARLAFNVVEDIVRDGAFDEAVASERFDYVIHTACPYHFNITNPVVDFIDPAVKGTVGILKSVKDHAPTVTRFVLLSSSATILNPFNHSKVYDESVFGETTWEEAINPRLCYRAAKIFSEKAAFDFMDSYNPSFDLVVLNPPLVFGPAPRHLKSLDSLNTSNQRIRDLVLGKFQEVLPPTGPVYIFCDVRDVAEAHVQALQTPEAGGQRFFIVGGYFSNKKIVDLIRQLRPDLSHRLPAKETQDDMPQDVYGWDNSKSRKVLNLSYRDLETCVNDALQSFSKIEDMQVSD
ncbi:NAD-dependent epimerase/dehydratase [Pleurostoma richardsiae]|uniref:NAD-dependent epimerase/dehydratase n=1 Tax=Pleurostoma richardsiae TaxID=41990 RepID=A0AA38RTV3_9PEZI|nr:NAD-dependent epimerase/dehydratase [Pleurostoma richardsiae]